MTKPTPNGLHNRIKLLPGEARGQNNLGRRPLAKRTLDEVALIMGISRERVRQLERIAFWKIRRRLGDYVEELRATGLLNT